MSHQPSVRIFYVTSPEKNSNEAPWMIVALRMPLRSVQLVEIDAAEPRLEKSVARELLANIFPAKLLVTKRTTQPALEAEGLNPSCRVVR